MEKLMGDGLASVYAANYYCAIIYGLIKFDVNARARRRVTSARRGRKIAVSADSYTGIDRAELAAIIRRVPTCRWNVEIKQNVNARSRLSRGASDFRGLAISHFSYRAGRDLTLLNASRGRGSGVYI